MKRLLLTAFALSIMMSALSVIAILVGRARKEPNEMKTLGFDVCGSRPCLMGIIPGKTAWNDAESYARSRYGYIGNRVLTVNTRQIAVEIYPDTSGSSVGALLVRYLGVMAGTSIGHFIELYGLPCAVISENTRTIWLQYPFGSVDVDLISGYFAPESPINKITLIVARNDVCMYGGSETAHPWSGFASPRRYELIRVWK